VNIQKFKKFFNLGEITKKEPPKRVVRTRTDVRCPQFQRKDEQKKEGLAHIWERTGEVDGDGSGVVYYTCLRCRRKESSPYIKGPAAGQGIMTWGGGPPKKWGCTRKKR